MIKTISDYFIILVMAASVIANAFGLPNPNNYFVVIFIALVWSNLKLKKP